MKKPLYSLIVISVALVFMGAGCTSGCTTSNSDEVSQYNDKVLELNSDNGKLQGKVLLREKEGKLLAKYHFLLNDKLKDNNKCPLSPNWECGEDSYGYEYAVALKGKMSPERTRYVDTLTSVYCNSGKLPEDLNKNGNDIYYYSACHDDYHQGKKTEEFYIYLSQYFDSYEDFIGINKFSLYGASDFWEPSERDEGAYTLNTNKAVEEGDEYRTYEFEAVE